VQVCIQTFDEEEYAIMDQPENKEDIETAREIFNFTFEADSQTVESIVQEVIKDVGTRDDEWVTHLLKVGNNYHLTQFNFSGESRQVGIIVIEITKVTVDKKTLVKVRIIRFDRYKGLGLWRPLKTALMSSLKSVEDQPPVKLFDRSLQQEPYNRIKGPDWYKVMLKHWREGKTSAEISKILSTPDQYVDPKIINKRISELRKIYGVEVVPYHTDKMRSREAS
jgi:hypothetical protein